MRTYKLKLQDSIATVVLISGLLTSCGQNGGGQKTAGPPPIGATPSVRLNFRYEADVPAPAADAAKRAVEERNPGVQADFDATRSLELLDRTITSPDGKHVAA